MKWVSIEDGTEFTGSLPDEIEVAIAQKGGYSLHQGTYKASDKEWPDALAYWMILNGYIQEETDPKSAKYPSRKSDTESEMGEFVRVVK